MFTAIALSISAVVAAFIGLPLAKSERSRRDSFNVRDFPEVTAGAGDFIPASDADFLAWSINFDTVLTADEAAYGLLPADSAAYDTLHDAFAAALTLATDPSTRTSVTVADKVAKRAAVEFKARTLAAVARAFPTVTDEDLVALGLTVRDTVPTPIGPPATKPVLNVEQILNLATRLRIRDIATPSSNAKPFGAIGCEVFVSYGATPPASVATMTYVGLATRALFDVSHDVANAGMQAWFIGRWVNARGDIGPTADQVSATVAS